MLRIAYGGANWIVVPLGLALLMGGIGLTPELGVPWLVPLSAVPFFFAVSMVMFMRDPERRVADGVCSGADGRVVRIDQVDDPDLGRCDRLSVFMSPLDVHVNRMPFPGSVRSVEHRPGNHVPAFSKDSDNNEQVRTILRVEKDEPVDGGTLDVKVVQIAGSMARRILPYVAPGDHVRKGDRMGLIKLGSRFDILVPEGRIAWQARLKQKVYAGSTQVGAWR